MDVAIEPWNMLDKSGDMGDMKDMEDTGTQARRDGRCRIYKSRVTKDAAWELKHGHAIR